MREYTIAAVPADGIGPEVIAAGLEVLQALTKKVGDFQLKVEIFLGARTTTKNTA
jgi:tartrate dehydrogenase/decarboxylase / D-malate dehydrogenase